MRIPDIWDSAQNFRLLDIRHINAADGTEGIIKVPRETSLIIVSVKQGSIGLWLGDYTGRTGDPPDLFFGQSNRPVFVPIPGNASHFTYLAESVEGNALASIIIGGP